MAYCTSSKPPVGILSLERYLIYKIGKTTQRKKFPLFGSFHNWVLEVCVLFTALALLIGCYVYQCCIDW